MGLDPARNFAVGTLASGIAAGATSFNLSSGEGTLFPAPASEGAFNGVIWNSTDYADPLLDPFHEIVRIGARSTDAFSSVTRGQEGTSDVAHNTAGKTYKFALVITRKLVQDVDARLTDGAQQYAADSGSANAYAITLSPAPSAYAAGQEFRFKAANANTGASTLNVNALGAKTIKGNGGASLAAAEIQAGQMVTVQYDGTDFQLTSQSLSPSTIQRGTYNKGSDTGSANTYAVALSPAPGSYAEGLVVRFKPGNTNSGASTLNVNSLGAKDLKDREGSALVGGELTAGTVYEAYYDGTEFRVLGVLAVSEVRLDAGNGHGSTNTCIRRFTNTRKNVGASITYADSATLGASFTINKAGVYAIGFVDRYSASTGRMGISLNSAQGSTSIASITDADRLTAASAFTDEAGLAYVVVALAAGDVIRPHTNGANNSANAYTSSFSIARVR